jgi:hypothetical protein
VVHFYTAAFLSGGAEAFYVITAVLLVASLCVGLVAYVARFRDARGPEITRMRWVAAAIAIYIAIAVIFFVAQMIDRGAEWPQWLVLLNPAPYAFAYALVQGQIVDIRMVGGRAVIYALVTSVPVALLAFAEWFFARRLEDARLATVFEIAIAIGFSFWLRTLHKRIDRFAERVFFASRHRAFVRMRHLTHALPQAERVATIEDLLTAETAQEMRFSSAALFRLADGGYVRVAAVGWYDAAESLDADDPLLLLARSTHRGTYLSEAPRSKALLPGGAEKPVFALPIVGNHHVLALVLYGGHRDGEAIDAEEEQLLADLAHAAATAYEHLRAVEIERENAALRTKLATLTHVTDIPV